MKLSFHTQEPGYDPIHFDRMMPIDQVTIAMFGCLYDELEDEEEQDLVIAHCLGQELPAGVPVTKPKWRHPRGVPRSQRRI